MAVTGILLLCLLCSNPILNGQAQAQGKAAPAAQIITVLSPMGTPPPIKLKPMAPRLNTLEGKTIYVVDQGYLGTDNLLFEKATSPTRTLSACLKDGAFSRPRTGANVGVRK